MTDLTASEFSEIVRKGMLAADREYLEWTGGWGVPDGGIEGFITSWIAKQLIETTRKKSGARGGYVALELTLDRLINDLSPDDRSSYFKKLIDKTCKADIENASSLKKKSRIDLVFYDGWWPENETKLRPRGVVEVKRWFDKNTYPKDMRRIRCLLDTFGPAQGGSLLYGCFVFYLFERSRTSVEAAIEKIQNLQNDFQKYGGPCRIESAPALAAEDGPAKAASVAVLFEAPIRNTCERGGKNQ